MIKIENTEVAGWRPAIMGARNPKNSWNRSDTDFTRGLYIPGNQEEYAENDYPAMANTDIPEIGTNDITLLRNLANAGTDHGKFLRMIAVYADVTAPLYWYKEYDTYKVGTVANSCSTMHKIDAKEFTIDDFSYDLAKEDAVCRKYIEDTISMLNKARNFWLETKDKKYWRYMIELLPSSYNQKRTVMLNYAVLKNMYFARKNHKLSEWHTFCGWIETLPYSKDLIIGGESHD